MDNAALMDRTGKPHAQRSQEAKSGVHADIRACTGIWSRLWPPRASCVPELTGSAAPPMNSYICPISLHRYRDCTVKYHDPAVFNC